MTEPAAPRERVECASEDEVLAFAAGRLSTAQRRELHTHFDDCQHCQQLLNEAVHALATAQTSGFGRDYDDDDDDDDDLTWSATFRPGTVVGQRYVIRQFIARGGMGEVYEAFDRELQERVALKTVTSTAGDNRGAVRRLKAEVQLARRVSHPNVCRIYDFGTHAVQGALAPISFLTMEFVEGETLGQRIRKGGALPVAEARKLGRELLAGLRAAHAAGVLHRDFKSDNVMLRRSEHGFSPLILDFGLARALDEHPSSSASHRGLVGTLAYIAPEQFEGRPHTTAGDVYSFGVVWFEMLTGELPFKPSSSPTVTTLDRLTRPAAPPSTANPLVPPDLDELVLRCLRRTEQERFKTAAEVLARLDELESRSRLPRRPRRVALSAAAGVMLAAGAFAMLGAHQVRIASDQKRPASASSRVRSPSLPAFAAEAAAASLLAPAPAPAATPVQVPVTPAVAPATPPTAPSPKSRPRDPKPADAELRAPAGAKPTSAPVEPKPPSGWENPFGSSG